MDRFLGDVDGQQSDLDRKLLHQLTFGTVRWLRFLDHVIESASQRSIEQIDEPLRTPLRISTYEILFLDRVPTYASVNEAVEEARRRTHRRGGAFVNAVLRKVGRRYKPVQWPVKRTDPIERLAIETSHPDFLVRRWIARFGEAETRRLLAINNLPKPIHLLTFTDRGDGEKASADLNREGVQSDRALLSPCGLIVRAGDPFSTQVFARGDLYGQDAAGQDAAQIPLPRPGERVLDMAAAPGGKTLGLLAREPDLENVAADLSLPRLLRLRDNFRRLGRACGLVVADARQPPFQSGFDRVILDLPCSGTGTLRKHPELKWRISSAELDRLSNQGRQLLEGASRLPRPGGVLILITCSLEEEESVGVIGELMQRSDDYELVDLKTIDLGAPVEFVVGEGFWRVLPADDHDGMTVHVLRRRSS